MKGIITWLTGLIIQFLDLIYPFFSKFVNKQTFRYAACGGANTVFDIMLFFVIYNFVLRREMVLVGPLSISPHIASFLLTFPITFLSGFLLLRYVVFPESAGIRKREQMPKYLTVVFICILLNYAFLKLFVEYFGWWPLPSKILTTFFVVIFSYLSQKNFTFRKTGLKSKIY